MWDHCSWCCAVCRASDKLDSPRKASGTRYSLCPVYLGAPVEEHLCRHGLLEPQLPLGGAEARGSDTWGEGTLGVSLHPQDGRGGEVSSTHSSV